MLKEASITVSVHWLNEPWSFLVTSLQVSSKGRMIGETEVAQLLWLEWNTNFLLCQKFDTYAQRSKIKDNVD